MKNFTKYLYIFLTVFAFNANLSFAVGEGNNCAALDGDNQAKCRACEKHTDSDGNSVTPNKETCKCETLVDGYSSVKARTADDGKAVLDSGKSGAAER